MIYGGDWTWANFYDENGHVVRSKPRRTSEVIRLPVLELSEKQELIGWDLDGDGKADSVPATSVVDVNARPVIRLSYTPGDINGDNTVDETDIFVLRQYLVGIKVEVVVGALDPNGDGFTNMRDVALLAQYIAGLTAVLH